MVRVGYALGYGKFTNAKEMADVMRQAEERGFEMAFFSETIELMRDSVSSLAAIGLATKNLRLGSTQIVRLRGPVVMAQSLATLDELTGGRMTLAPGACTKSHARVHALPADVGATPTEVLREYIESMRLLLTGEKVSYHGKFVNFDNVGLGWKPIRAHSRSRQKKPDGISPSSKSHKSSTAPSKMTTPRLWTPFGGKWPPNSIRCRFPLSPVRRCGLANRTSGKKTSRFSRKLTLRAVWKGSSRRFQTPMSRE